MKKLFTFKTLTAKITFIIGATVIIVAGSIAGYMQMRILSEIDRHTKYGIQIQALETAKEFDKTFLEANSNETEVSLEQIENLVSNVKVYDTGFALLHNTQNEFVGTGNFANRLDTSEMKKLADTSSTKQGEAFEVKLNNINYLTASSTLMNDYTVFIAAPLNEVNADTVASLIRFVVIFVTCFILVIILSYFISKPISKPLTALSAFLKRTASTGDLKLKPEDIEAIEKYSQIKDETGQVVEAAAKFINHIEGVSKVLGVMASGDLTHDAKLQSENDTMGTALHHMFSNLREIFGKINQSAVQIAMDSKQIADGSQALAQGSTQQTASVEQFSASMTEISQKTKDSAEMAGRAADFANIIKESAEKGNRQMGEMMEAVKEINQAGQSIGKVIKVIDDIAFQTNILALNAAVEAARAGQHGKGFAVVAEEVRNLASKSAEAAKDTGSLIVNSMEKAELGARIADETAASLEGIVSGISESNQIVAQIAISSKEQSEEISQINVGIDQVAQVIQQNSATAEESSAASQDLSEQAEMLKNLITQFRL